MAKDKLGKLLSNPILIQPHSSSLSGQDLSQAPSSPGIYIFADAAHNPLYIGKSISLKSRLLQHLESSKQKDTKASHFFPLCHYLYLQPTESDLAAIILEVNLIKTYLPYYNTQSKDDKTNVYITIDNPPHSKINLVRTSDLYLKQYDNPKTQIYGPFLSAMTAQALLKKVRQIFGYCTQPFNKEKRSCFYYHLRQCPGACNGKVNLQDYKKHLSKIKIFLSGRFNYLVKELNTQIKKAAKAQKFEEAHELKRQLNFLNSALHSQQYEGFLTLPSPTTAVLSNEIKLLNHPLLNTAPKRIECYDMATLNQENTVGVMVVFENGIPNKSEYRKFIVRSNRPGDPAAMQHILKRRLRHDEWPKPDLIILDGGVPQLSIVSQVIPPDIPTIALSKKRETLHFFDGTRKIININLPLHNPLLRIFQFARDEAHRFGTTFHKTRREKSALT